jgi:hypothetical protein
MTKMTKTPEMTKICQRKILKKEQRFLQSE